ncbi:MAG: tetratricopeptide repeat protein [Acidobacteriota bacterium]
MSALKKTAALALLVLAVSAMPAAAEDRIGAREQNEFGIRVAQQGLWREAIFRWERAVELDPTYAAAFNNLAIAYETQGDFERAKRAYERAVELDPRNVYIKQNFDLFKEINDRASRQDPR